MPPRDGNDVGCNRIPAARENAMSSLHSRLVAGFAERLQFLVVALNLAGLGHLVNEIRYEEAKTLLLLGLHQSVANLVALGGKVRVRGRLVFEQLKYGRIRATIDGTADFSGLHGEGYGSLTRHGADIGNLSVGQNQIAGLVGSAEFFGGALEIMFRLGPIGELLSLLTQQLPGALVLEFLFDLAANFLKGRG